MNTIFSSTCAIHPKHSNLKQLTTSQFLELEYGRATFVGGSSAGAAVAAELASGVVAAAAGRVAGVAVPSSSGQSAGDFFVIVTSS